jgi:hypothetical protein
MTMQAVTDRPRVIAVRPLAPPEARPTTAALASARGAMIGTVIALFPWSLVILFLSWLF